MWKFAVVFACHRFRLCGGQSTVHSPSTASLRLNIIKIFVEVGEISPNTDYLNKKLHQTTGICVSREINSKNFCYFACLFLIYRAIYVHSYLPQSIFFLCTRLSEELQPAITTTMTSDSLSSFRGTPILSDKRWWPRRAQGGPVARVHRQVTNTESVAREWETTRSRAEDGEVSEHAYRP